MSKKKYKEIVRKTSGKVRKTDARFDSEKPKVAGRPEDNTRVNRA